MGEEPHPGRKRARVRRAASDQAEDAQQDHDDERHTQEPEKQRHLVSPSC